MSAHIGKIGRLPEAIREQLNQRLADGEPGGPLLEWLNSLPGVQKVLAAQFGGEPIKEQNLSNWRTGGFLHWQQQRDRRAVILEMTADSQNLDGKSAPAGHGDVMSRHFSRVFAADLAVSARNLLDTVTDPAERCERIQEILETLRNLRREGHRDERMKMGWERWEFERERQQGDQERQRQRERDVEQLLRMAPGGGL